MQFPRPLVRPAFGLAAALFATTLLAPSPARAETLSSSLSTGPGVVKEPAASIPVTSGLQAAALPRPVNATRFESAFILKAAAAARSSQWVTDVPASVTIAQAILESDWGRSELSTEYNNYFGIKALTKPGSAGVAWFDVWEVIDDEDVIQTEPFRAYNNAVESFVDHGEFFLGNRRYRRALAVRSDPRAFARAINRAGYATDPDYAPKLIELMDRFDLYIYDLPPASGRATLPIGTGGLGGPGGPAPTTLAD